MMRNTERDAAGSPAVLACWGGRKKADREAQDEAPTARTLPSHTTSDNRFPGYLWQFADMRPFDPTGFIDEDDEF